MGITSDPKISKNVDLKTEGRFREINLIIEPFNLNKNYEVINESKNGIIDISSNDSANRAFKNPHNEKSIDVEITTNILKLQLFTDKS